MMKFLFTMFATVNSQFIPGSQVDPSGHGCILDGGYQWCEEMNTCVRSWEVDCPSLMEPVVDECSTCPPPMPCPMPYVPHTENCKLNSYTDNCGCQTRCPSFDCTNDSCNSDSDCHSNQFCRPMQMRIPMVNGRRVQAQASECVDKVGINETCGGYTPPEFQTRCLDNLECVNTMGPMIADAPGQCKEPCPNNSRRDQYGNCQVANEISIPDNCATWHDGCNTCQVRDGRAEICTLMYCFRNDEPYCMSYHIQSNSLNVGDVCYRFCENGSQDFVNRRSDCPANTKCVNPLQFSEVSFDSCSDRAWTCQSSH